MEQQGRIETWVHCGTGLVAVSTVAVSDAGDAVSEYCLKIWIPGGDRCSAALAFGALADFGFLNATEDQAPCGAARVFRDHLAP